MAAYHITPPLRQSVSTTQVHLMTYAGRNKSPTDALRAKRLGRKISRGRCFMSQNKNPRRRIVVLITCSIVLLANLSYGAINVPLFVQGQIPFYEPFNGPANLETYVLTLDKGDSSGWHYHPGPAYVIVASGTLTEDEGCGRVTKYSAGSAFSETPGVIHNVINNDQQQVVLYVTQIYPPALPDFFAVDGPACVGPPISESQCKSNGWMTFNVPRRFKNQGECVSYVENGH
jgi:quercetin dioxygenase-like cupin family protein